MQKLLHTFARSELIAEMHY